MKRNLFKNYPHSWTAQKKAYFIVFVVLFSVILNATSAVAQNKITITGSVVDNTGEPVIGANILEKGTMNGVFTDADGNYSINAAGDGTLVVSFVGYETAEEQIAGRTSIKVTISEGTMVLDQVVVTAMGIKRKESSLTYSAQIVGGDELTRAKDPNMVNSLAGKTAGVQINKSSAGLGGSAKVSIRGTRSAFAGGNNQPLYVIDGVPMLNTSTESSSTALGGENDGMNRDAGDGISNLNPDDIESMSILKGASAAALYGSQAANGVVLITTKQGRAGAQRITFSSNLTVDNAISLPKFQNSYGRTPSETGNAISSWGEKANLKDYNNVDNYYSTGVTAINSLSFMGGTEKAQTYFSYANTTAQGIVETNKLQKNNITFRETANFFKDRLKLDGNVNLVSQTIKNSPASGGYYLNPLVGLYTFPRGLDLGIYQNQFETFDQTRQMNVQNWYIDVANNANNQNPYWLRNRVLSENNRIRAIASLNASLKINDWLSLQARGNIDYASDKFESKMYASTSQIIAGEYEGKANGRYIWSEQQDMLTYGDLMALFNHKMERISINGAFGTTLNMTTSNGLMLDSRQSSLYRPNVFTVPNMVLGTGGGISQTINAQRTTQSVFATAQVGLDDALYLDVAARNDWSSTLAHTTSMNSGFFYPSVGLSWIASNTIELPEWVNFAKVRGSFAQVGSDLPIGITNPQDIILSGGAIRPNDTEQRGDLKPEISTSYEAGMEWRFFNHRLGFDFTLYQTNTKNQLLRLPNAAGSLYAYRYVNAGLIRNRGLEFTVDGTPIATNGFRWKTAFNGSTNRNRVMELHSDYKQFVYGDEGASQSYQMIVKEGGRLGDFYGLDFERDENGAIKVDENGVPSAQSDKVLVGNANPDFLLGWSNTFTYKGVSLFILIDGRFGGNVMSFTQAELDLQGASQNTATARDQGYVEYEGQRFTNVQGFYNTVGGLAGISKYYTYSATNIRIREVSLNYSLPSSIVGGDKFVKGVDIAFVARNLAFLYKKAPFDPDAIMSVGNNNQGLDVFGLPTTRNLGFNLKLTF
ncbi:MAG: SusC/RagA family TonB-linked outer membrane protein [Bacteroidales bacterium]